MAPLLVTCSGLEVFVDEEFAPSGVPAPSSEGIAKADERSAGQGKWAQLETWEQGRKENVQAPGKWAGAKLKQKKSLVAPAAPPLDVPQDEELTELGGTPGHVHATPQVTLFATPLHMSQLVLDSARCCCSSPETRVRQTDRQRLIHPKGLLTAFHVA